MKWLKNRPLPAQRESSRTVSKFAWLPTELDEPKGTVCWLESYQQEQRFEFRYQDLGLNNGEWEWVPVKNIGLFVYPC